MVLGLTILSFLTQGSMAKALLMACLGIVLGLIGIDRSTRSRASPSAASSCSTASASCRSSWACSASPRS